MDFNGIKFDLGYDHDIKNYQVFECNYYSLDTFLNAIKVCPINYRVFPHPASIYHSSSFSGVKSFEEAWNLCRFTQDEGYDSFISGLNSINFKKSEIIKQEKDYNVVGFSPNVAKFLNGNPSNMKRNKTIAKNTKITVLMECSYSASTNINEIINRGICVINLIRYLEKNGFDVCLQFETNLVNNNQMIKINVPIKRDEEKLNIKMCYFPLVNPAFLRRLIFRAIEILDGLDYDWNNGYGYPYKRNDREIMELTNTIYISTPREMGILGIDLQKDFDNFVEYINNKYNLEEMLKGDDKECHRKVYGKRV